MLSANEIARGVQGALRLLRGDRAAPFNFESTAGACARSFRLMALVAPLYAFCRLIEYTDFEVAADEWEIASVEALRYLLDWLLYPVLFYEIARRRGWEEKYFRYIVALNWIDLPATILVVIGTALAAMAPGLASVMALLVNAVVFYWFLMATRLIIGVSWPMAGLLLVVNWVPMTFVSLIINRILGVAAVTG